MADTFFVNMVTLTDADWFNDMNRLHYTIFQDPSDLQSVKDLLGLGSGGSGGSGGAGGDSVLIQDPVPSGILEGGQWFESDTGKFYLRYQNPDDTYTWIGINSSGPKGNTGDPGPQGVPGPAGPPGPTGGARLPVACSDETTALTTGAAKVTFRMDSAMVLTRIKASLTVASTSGALTVDVNRNGVSLFSTLLTIDANEKTSVTAATPAVLAATLLDDDDEITIDLDAAGTGAKGLKVYLI